VHSQPRRAHDRTSPIRSGIGKAIAAGAPGGLHPWEITIAEMLGDAGYRTAIFGKWHLGTGAGRLPTDQGFDEWFGYETSDVSYWTGNPGMSLKDVHLAFCKPANP
jgi:arylsulfatase A-like enzyme